MSKTYILQKDSLAWALNQNMVIKAGAEVSIFDNKYITKTGWWFAKDFVENNPEWFKLKEQPKEVDTFQWDDSKVKEYLRLVTSVEGDGYWQQEINKFKQSKSTPQKEDKGTEVKILPFEYQTGDRKIEFWSYEIQSNKSIPPEKYESIKKAIEAIVNNENLTMDFTGSFDYLKDKKYTEKELQEAFNAGRCVIPPYEPYKNDQLYLVANTENRLLYPNFNNYISKKK
jgi:hypothetical protein